MAVAEARKMEEGREERSGSSAPAWLAGPLGFGPRKVRELRSFLTEVKGELKKVTWPSQAEVKATTVVVIVTTIAFGFYLYAMDLGFSFLLSFILKK
jgi:preprotein translocase subunit SecE